MSNFLRPALGLSPPLGGGVPVFARQGHLPRIAELDNRLVAPQGEGHTEFRRTKEILGFTQRLREKPIMLVNQFESIRRSLNPMAVTSTLTAEYGYLDG